MKTPHYAILSLGILMSVLSYGATGSKNGGFAYTNSEAILEIAKQEILRKIPVFNHPDLSQERKDILKAALENMVSESKRISTRDGELLMFDYDTESTPARIVVLKPYFDAYSAPGKNLYSFFSIEIERRLLHEASHIWGFNEYEAKAFSDSLLSQERFNREHSEATCRAYVKLIEPTAWDQSFVAIVELNGEIAYSQSSRDLGIAAFEANENIKKLTGKNICRDLGPNDCQTAIRTKDDKFYSAVTLPGTAMMSRHQSSSLDMAVFYMTEDLKLLRKYNICR